MPEEWNKPAVSGGDFASLAAGLLARKGEAEPSAIMAPETFPSARRAAPAREDAPVLGRSTPQRKRRELPALSTVAGTPAKPPRIILQLSAKEYEALALVAVKSGTTPQNLMRKVVSDFLTQPAPEPAQPVA